MQTFEYLISLLPSADRILLEELKTLRERPDHHPEPSTFEHIRIVTTRCLETNDPDLVCTALYHDLFKLKCAVPNPKSEYPMCPGHDVMSRDYVAKEVTAQEFCKSLGANPEIVAWICGEHIRVQHIDGMRQAKQDRLRNHPWFSKLSLFARADEMREEFKLEEHEKTV